MTITTTLTDSGDGTDFVAVHQNFPAGVSPAANGAGWEEALARLATLVEAG
jgi:hypothetical protein